MTEEEVGAAMTKFIAVFLLLAMAVHIIRPLGLPGLRKRADFWKIAILAFAIFAIALMFREFSGA